MNDTELTSPANIFRAAAHCDYHGGPDCKIMGRRIRCSSCKRPAVRVHLIPSVVDVRRIEATCSKHGAGGYEIEMRDGVNSRDGWLVHLAAKRSYACNCELDGPRHAVRDLLAWLGRKGLEAWR